MPHSVHGLCLMLNNVSWGKARLDEIARRLRRRLPGLLAIPRAELRTTTAADVELRLNEPWIDHSPLAHGGPARPIAIPVPVDRTEAGQAQNCATSLACLAIEFKN